jgi:hypothetical protein
MDQDWGPWIECDGSGGPVNQPGTVVQVCMDLRLGPHLVMPPDEGCNSATWPGFFWRWRRVRTGWFRSELRRVCDNPAYAPIKRYRIRRPRAIEQLIRLAADPYVPPAVIGPEGPLRLPERVRT